MLDECKGDRLEEVLAVFSSAVLKKVVVEEQLNSNEYPVAAQTLALENRGYAGERAELNALILAHRVSLTGRLRQKNAAKAQYTEFAGLLDAKERGLAQKREQIKIGEGKSRIPRLSEDAKLDMRRAVRNNWSGNERWMEALLYGDATSLRDGVLTAPFDRVWRRVQSNRFGELEDKSGGLLEQLDSRVRTQQQRLGKWQNFRKELFGDDVNEARGKGNQNPGQKKGIDLGFGAHESLQPGRTSPRKLTGANVTGLDGEYRSLLKDLETELKVISQGSSGGVSGQSKRCRGQPLRNHTQRSSREKAIEEPVSELSELEEELAKAYVPPPSRPIQQSSNQLRDAATDSEASLSEPQKPTRPRLPQALESMHASRPRAQSNEVSFMESPKPTSPQPRVSSPRHSPIREHDDLPSSPEHSPDYYRPRGPQQPTSIGSSARDPPRLTESPEPMPPSPTQQQADQILASMNAASPSPMKQARPRHTLSLAERTRLSMVRTLSMEEEDELNAGTPSPLRRRTTSSRSPTKKSKPMSSTPPAISEDAALADNEDEDGLVARTRKSMANFEATQQRIRLERQLSQKREAKRQSLTNRSGEIARQSYFRDGVDEEAEGEGNSSMMLEELIAKEAAMGQKVDYDSIFKSRPKIKASPPGTPARNHFEE